MANPEKLPARVRPDRIALTMVAGLALAIGDFGAASSQVASIGLARTLLMWLPAVLVGVAMQCYLVYFCIWRVVVDPGPSAGLAWWDRLLEASVLILAGPLLNSYLVRLVSAASAGGRPVP